MSRAVRDLGMPEAEFKTDLSHDCPLCIDMDGTLLKTDTFIESILLLLRVNALECFRACVWLLHGKARLKQELAYRVMPSVAYLPFRDDFLKNLREQHEAGRKLVLITGAHTQVAQKVANHVGLFDQILATEGETNLTGGAKLQALRTRFGEKGYDYAGNEHADLHIWEHARNAIVVGSSDRVIRRARRRAHVTNVVEPRCHPLPYIKEAIRPHQWVKNLLLFVPLITSHQIAQGQLVFSSVLAFAAFCLCASSAYVLNDLLDLESDRRHPSKRNRPFASGNLSLWGGLALGPGLLLSGFAIGSLLPLTFLWLLALYVIATIAYSLSLKKRAIVDVLVLASLYTIRVYAGAEAIEVILSPWLLAFSGFTFLSLAFTKRCSELLMIGQAGEQAARGRGYWVSDLPFVLSVGPASGYMACLVLALYTSSPDVAMLYSHPGLLWLLCPVFLYWFSHIWLLCSRNMMPYDPIIFAAKDRASYAVGAAAALIMLLAK